MKKPTKSQLLQGAKNSFFDRMIAQPEIVDDDMAIEQWDNAETTIETYLAKLDEGSTDIPNAQDLAVSCGILLLMAGIMTDKDFEFLALVHDPVVGVDLVKIRPQIEDVRRRAVQELESRARSPQQAVECDPKDLPF